jgi:cell division protein FtsQ
MAAIKASKQQQALRTQERVGIHVDRTDGLAFVSDQQVLALVSRDYEGPIQGAAISGLELSRIEGIVRTIPQLDEVDAYVDLNGRIGINITQKQPLARVLHTDGVSYYIDKTGEMVPLSDNFTARVPVITGALTPLQAGQNVSDNSMWHGLFRLIQSIHVDRFSHALLEQIHREPSGDLVLVPKLGDFVIRFGKVEDSASRLRKLRAFYERSIHEIDLDDYESIDLRFKGQVVCKTHSS